MKVNKEVTVQVFDGTEFDNVNDAINYCKKHSNIYAFEFHAEDIIDWEKTNFEGYILIKENNEFCKPIWGAEYWAYLYHGNRIGYPWNGSARESWKIIPTELTDVNPDEILYWRKDFTYRKEDEKKY